jgi:hypothetical protein
MWRWRGRAERADGLAGRAGGRAACCVSTSMSEGSPAHQADGDRRVLDARKRKVAGAELNEVPVVRLTHCAAVAMGDDGGSC